MVNQKKLTYSESFFVIATLSAMRLQLPFEID